jgi:preprotein translocase subunit SecF
MTKFTNLGNDLHSGAKAFNIVGRRKTWYALSAVLLTISIGTLGVRGLNLGIEFKGGAEFVVPVANASTADVTAAREVIVSSGHTAASVTIIGSERLRIQTETLETTESTKVSAALASEFGVADSEIKIQLVGPTWGDEVTKNAGRALAVFLVLVALFLAIYFELRMALAALIALVHDVVITVGIYALIGFEVTPATVIGFLTILGYSLYDTVVVFDKVKENTAGLAAGSRMTYSEAANLALNQTLVRSINTTVVALLPVVSILVVGLVALGAGTLNDLALALLLGMLVGTFSSIFIATPFLAELKERTPEMQALAKRVSAKRKNSGVADGSTPALHLPVVTGTRQQRVRKPKSKR